MKKAILCFPYVPGRQSQYPMGIYKIASFCKDFYDITVLDQRIESNVINIISELLAKNSDILCIGLSVMTGEQIKHAIDISKAFHSYLPIIWGGMHPTILPQQTLESGLMDYLVIGEGEEAFLNLLLYLSGKPIANEMFLSKSNRNFKYNYIEDLNNAGYVDFSTYKIREDYFIKRDGFNKAFTLETSRGCPYNCYYCHNSIYKKPFRSLSPDKVLRIIDTLKVDYKIDGVIFQEDNFFANLKRAQEIVQGLYHIPNVGWKTNSRINYFYNLVDNEQFMDNLLTSRCKVIQFGIESGSPKILKMINKGIKVDKVIWLNKKLSTYHISIRYNFIVGFPGETMDDIQETFKLIEKLQADNPNVEPPFLNIYNPYPGTVLYSQALKFGFIEPKNLEGWSELNWNKPCLKSLPQDVTDFIERKSAEYFRKSQYLMPS
jgi:radical SAM superfamily enzyme YgiQ (UPF0313 family)